MHQQQAELPNNCTVSRDVGAVGTLSSTVNTEPNISVTGTVRSAGVIEPSVVATGNVQSTVTTQSVE